MKSMEEPWRAQDQFDSPFDYSNSHEYRDNLTTKAPVVIAPAMNPNTYSNPITQSNIKKLKEAGYHFIDPEYSKTACGTEGVGRLARIPVIINCVINFLEEQGNKEKEGAIFPQDDGQKRLRDRMKKI